MKNLITLLSLMAFAISSFAQIEKGTSAIGLQLTGNFNNSNSQNEFTKRRSTYWQIVSEARYEYFIKQNLSIGSALSYGINQSNFLNTPLTGTFETKIRNTVETYGFIANISKYWFIHPKVGFYITPRIGFFYNETTLYNRVANPAFSEDQQVARNYGTSWHHTAQVNTGICLFLFDNLTTNVNLELLRFRYTRNNQSLQLLNSNPIFSFGVTYFVR